MTKWFSRYELGETSDVQRGIIDSVGELLEQLQPRRLDPAQQSVARDRGETWIKLQHDSHPGLAIDLVLTDGWVNFYGVMGHTEAYSDSTTTLQAETIEILSQLLRADYTFETYSFLGRPWREVTTISGTYEMAMVSGLRSPVSALLPLRRSTTLTRSRRVTFECQQATA